MSERAHRKQAHGHHHDHREHPSDGDRPRSSAGAVLGAMNRRPGRPILNGWMKKPGELDDKGLDGAMASVLDGASGLEHVPDEDDDGENAGHSMDHAAEGLAATGVARKVPGLGVVLASPEVAKLVAQKKYKEAFAKVRDSVSTEEKVEIVKAFVKRFGTKAAEEALTDGAEGAALGVASFVEAAWQWTKKGFEEIHKAHEAGDRDSRIAIYSDAFSDGFLNGGGARANLGAVTKDEREAYERGVADGRAAAGHLGPSAPSVGRAILKKYGSPDEARRAIRDQLMERSGIHGVTTAAAPKKEAK